MKKIILLFIIVVSVYLFTQTTGGSGSDNEWQLPEVTANSSSQVMMVYKGTFDYTDTTNKNLIQLPAGAVIWQITINVTTSFNDGDTDYWNAGTTENYSTFAADAGISDIMHYSMNTANNTPSALTTQTYIVVRYQGDTGDATQGEADIYIHYTLP